MVKNLLKNLKNFFLHRAFWITTLSLFVFIAPAFLDTYIRRYLELPYEYSLLTLIGISLFVILVNFVIVRKWLSLEDVGLRRKRFIKSFLYSLIFVSLLQVLYYLNDKGAFKEIIWERKFFLLLSVYLLAAFEEELIFRGIIFKVWQKSKGFLTALFISSTLFGLVHLLYPALGFEEISGSRAVLSTLFGPTFALVFYRTKNIWGLALSHFIYNSVFVFTDQAAGETGTKTGFTFLAIGVSIFFPVVIDFVETRLSKLRVKKIKWSSYLVTVFSILFLLLSIAFLLEDFGVIDKPEKICPYIENEKVKACIEENKPKTKDCYGINLGLEKAKKKVNNNQKALEILQDNCLWLLDVKIHDLTGDGKEEIAMITAGAGCASCHFNRVYILKDEQIIFQKDAEDVIFWTLENLPAFAIKYPLRRKGEPLCCPSEGIIETYVFDRLDSEYGTFYKSDERTDPYKR